MAYILAIDQGTTSSRAILFDTKSEQRVVSQQEFKQYFPNDGWVEHDPKDIWHTVRDCCHDVFIQANLQAKDIAAIGITNQRETTIIWDRHSGVAIGKAIVWQDRRTSNFCQQLKEQGKEKLVSDKTGLLLDPYFSASKITWLLDNVDGARAKAEAGQLAFGTVDTFLLWHLTNGKVHATDATNASRTALFNIHTHAWDQELLELFNVPASLLPTVKNSADNFGNTSAELFGGEIPVCALIGDQQAALVGQACFQPGMAKSTYGTGCFLVLNTGSEALQSQHKLLTTVGYRLNNQTTYALEGSIFVAGAAVRREQAAGAR